MLNRKYLSSMLVLCCALALGCNQRSGAQRTAADDGLDPGGAAFLLDSEPDGGRAVIQARERAEDGDDVVVIGRIGGSVKPWVEGVAAFSIVDPSLEACNDKLEDRCKTPWDYCCETTTTLKQSSALVRFVDERGQTLRGDARKLLHLKELETVVVRGKARRDEAGNFTVLATGVHVRK